LTVYKAGKQNKVVDALSRMVEDKEGGAAELSVISRPYWQDVETIQEEV